MFWVRHNYNLYFNVLGARLYTILQCFRCKTIHYTAMFYCGILYVCMYVCMVITYSRVWINRVRLPILLVVSWTGQINTRYFPVPVHAWEFGLARRVQPSRPASACSFSILRLNMVLTHGIPPDFRGGFNPVRNVSWKNRKHRKVPLFLGGFFKIVHWKPRRCHPRITRSFISVCIKIFGLFHSQNMQWELQVSI